MENLDSYPLKCGGICYILVLYHSKLKFFKYDIGSFGNMNQLIGICGKEWMRMGSIDKIVGKHYLEKTQRGV